MKTFLFIDDERFPPNDGNTWAVVRSSAEAIAWVKHHGMPDVISFDHDLGGDDTSIKFLTWWIDDIFEQLENNVKYRDVRRPETTIIHSQNPVGAANIQAYIESIMNFLDSEEDR